MSEILAAIPYDRLIGAAIIMLSLLINAGYMLICLINKKPLSSWRFFSNLFGVGSILYSFVVFGAIIFDDLNQYLDMSIVYGSAGFAMLITGLMSLGVRFSDFGKAENEQKEA